MKMPESILIDGTYGGPAPVYKDRYLVVVDGKQVWLTYKSFAYLAKLADCHVRPGEAGWVYKDDLEAGANQSRYLYKLKIELQSQLGALDWAIVENNRLGWYRLNRGIKAVTILRRNLRSFPDHEIRNLAGVL